MRKELVQVWNNMRYKQMMTESAFLGELSLQVPCNTITEMIKRAFILYFSHWYFVLCHHM